jgi:hypothetical protein
MAESVVMQTSDAVSKFVADFLASKGRIVTIVFSNSIVQENRCKIEVYSEKGFAFETYSSFDKAMKDFLALSKHQEDNKHTTLQYRTQQMSTLDQNS